MSYTITLSELDVEQIILDELFLAYELNADPKNFDGSGHNVETNLYLLESLKTVIYYFAGAERYQEWLNKKKNSDVNETQTENSASSEISTRQSTDLRSVAHREYLVEKGLQSLFIDHAGNSPLGELAVIADAMLKARKKNQND